jgi:short-subunit dehydrogenase
MTARSLAGRVIVVTGAANGIGAATARLLAQARCAMALVDIDSAGLGSTRRSLPADAAAEILPADVRHHEELAELAHGLLARWGRVDAVVHGAAVVHPGSVDRCPVETIARQVDINLGGTLNVARAFLPLFRRQRAGHLLFISSLAGLVPLPGESIYAATKFAVRGFALSLALELRGSGVGVSVVCPDSTRTRMLDSEARDEGSSLSFSSAPLTAAYVARAIVQTLRRPRLEVTVPGGRGRIIRLLGAFPWLFPLLHPLLDRRGRINKVRYLAALEAGEA